MKRRKIAASVVALGLVGAVATTGLVRRSAAAPLETHETDANITRITTSVLEHSQFAHHPFDDALARLLLERYADALDGTRSLLFQSDIDEFAAAYGPTLAQATRRRGDTAAARAIFDRYLVRLEQRASYVADTLKTAQFDYTGHDTYTFDREQARRPAGLSDARALWRQELRAEYLQATLTGAPAPIGPTLSRRYAQWLQTEKALGPDQVLEIYLDTLAHVYDPHSDYLDHEEMQSFSIAMNLSLVGIGATLERADGFCRIHDLLAGGPAARSGLLKPGDRIVAVTQPGAEPIDVVNMPLSRTVELIRGPKGSKVTLKVLSASAPDGSVPQMVTLVRAAVQLQDQEAKARLVDLPTAHGNTVRLGVIDLPSFYAGSGGRGEGGGRSATADMAVLLGKLKAEHVKGIVLDLRNNGGGSLQEAISLTGLFIKKGPVVQTRDPGGDIEVGADTDPAIAYDGPLVLLMSRFSASATEILAGALQDYGRALVVGDSSSFGKGTVQSILPLARVLDQAGLGYAYDPGALKVTISKFYRPSGASTQLRGVASDIVLPSMTDVADVGESALPNPLPWDVVPSTEYDHLKRVGPYVSRLRAASARRVATNQAFTFLAEDIARLRRSRAANSVSLNEVERRDDLTRDKARRDERERAEGVLHAPRPTEYEITLENASASGLPPPAPPVSGNKKGAAIEIPPDQVNLAHERSTDNALVLNETLRILADYVDLGTAAAPQDGLASLG